MSIERQGRFCDSGIILGERIHSTIQFTSIEMLSAYADTQDCIRIEQLTVVCLERNEFTWDPISVIVIGMNYRIAIEYFL